MLDTSNIRDVSISSETKSTVLVVDDEPSNVQLLVDILDKEYRVLIATSGEQALKLLNKNDTIDIVLLDVHMPGMSGFEVLKQARASQSLKLLPIIMVTAHSEAREEAHALEQGATDFLSKPVSAARVKARVKHQLTLCQSTETIKVKNLALEEALQKLQETKDELTDFMAMVSHELRTPIAILQCETELLVDGVRQASKENLSSLLEETKHVSELINDMFELVLSEANALKYNMEELNLTEVIQHSVNLFQAKFDEKQLKLSLHLDSPLNDTQTETNIEGDRKRLRQVIDNLLENSLKYTDGGGEVCVQLGQNDQQITIDVSDSAPGIPDSAYHDIFDKFFRVDKSRNRALGGSGLGLAISKTIVEAHQGTIKAEESELGGVSIKFTIPKLSLG